MLLNRGMHSCHDSGQMQVEKVTSAGGGAAHQTLLRAVQILLVEERAISSIRDIVLLVRRPT